MDVLQVFLYKFKLLNQTNPNISGLDPEGFGGLAKKPAQLITVAEKKNWILQTHVFVDKSVHLDLEDRFKWL